MEKFYHPAQKQVKIQIRLILSYYITKDFLEHLLLVHICMEK